MCTRSKIAFDDKKCNHVVRDVASTIDGKRICHLRQCEYNIDHQHNQTRLGISNYSDAYNPLNPYFNTLTIGDAISSNDLLTWTDEDYTLTHSEMDSAQDTYYIQELTETWNRELSLLENQMTTIRDGIERLSMSK